ncbi:DNA internalization-related competence protein ComEC/Rec2 [Noviherbaspirillum galbum]|uniref:DNA internalization-related competence protein ComEC/Rec2 n=1 Tax=Noviherbaspirillum galbum TaxID=2709383 RepID=A0A6B3SLZ5_9BURK|nr:DNA internalization-related competence protein ComEC/Rec2 [Noviherbaspirillum galbum]NEX61783.1 DNA internalization-related competence protein ComEC/Rec2 [Noviherbaspirillum galbum]
MRLVLLGFAIGVVILQTLPALPPAWMLAAFLVFGVAGMMLMRRLERHDANDANSVQDSGDAIVASGLDWRRAFPKAIACLLAGIAAGLCWACLVAQYALGDALPPEWEGRDITLTGTVSSLPSRSQDGLRFQFAVESAQADAGPAVVPRHLALSWYGSYGMQRGKDGQAVPDLRPGERWQLAVRLKRPHGNVNPFGFDYEVWLLEQGLRATGSVRPGAANRRLDAFVVAPGHVVERCRGWLRDRIHAALPGREYAGVIVALVIGDQREISQPDWKIFNRTGIGHLVSISGLHITMVAGMMAALVSALWRRSFFTGLALPVRLPAQQAAALAGMLTALVYVLLAGFGVPAQRTLYMLGVVGLALWTGRLTQVIDVLCLALAVVLLLDPWAVLWPGFWLSFGAVAIILYASAGRIAPGPAQSRLGGIARQLRAAAHVQAVVTLGMVPLTLLLFGQVSLISPVANAFAIPLVSFVVTPLSLAGSILPAPLGQAALLAAHGLVAGLAACLGWLSSLPQAVWSTALPAWWMFAAALAGCLWMLAPAGWPARWLGAGGLLPMLLNAPAHPAEGELWATFFDVGQGAAVLIETPGHALLYDAGPLYGPDSDGGSRVILPYLRARGIQSLDGMVLSHSDADHTGGASSILDEIRVGWLSSSLPPDHALVRRAPRHVRCEAGQAWDWDGTRMSMLHPTPGSYDNPKWKPNARSCTLKLTHGTHALLLTGDIEAPQERELLGARAADLPATVLLAPHHGSGTSSTEAFLRAVHPELAIFQAGYRNRYHHPKAEVFERYGRLGVQRMRTDVTGAVTLVFAQDWSASAERVEHARYWQGR